MSDGFSHEVAGVSSVVERLASVGYDVQHLIGSGAGGQVHKAVQRSTGQAVAIKIMALGDVDAPMQERRIERFRREIAFCSSLYHPDIVRLLDSGELVDGNRFAVFEFIPGRTLADLLRDEGMLKVQRARSLMTQALPPLAYAHAKGIAHRDLKPGNVMVTTDGGRDRLKVLDFGISVSINARDDAELVRLTRSHEWIGTPLYAAPEQLRGEPTGPKSDMYAWALMFIECLTGASLISGKSLLEIMAQQSRPEPHVLPPALANHRLGALLLRVLEKDTARRLGDAQLVHSLLERISMDGLEDGQGYLREASPVSAQFRARRTLTDTVTDSEPAPQTEQRHVTALCCRVSLFGTGAMSDVEQVDALLDDSYNLVSEVLEQFGATPAQSVGGYSLWYFGTTQARDADGRLAIRGALEVVNRTETLPSWFGEKGLSLVVQIGIHAGPVTLQVTEAGRKPVDGVTARVAMELAALDPRAEGITGHRVLVSDDFRQLVSRYAEFDPKGAGAVQLPWRAQPVQVHRMTGESRSTGLRSERAPFVGRDAELAKLTAAWKNTGAGEGSAVLLEGEPGVGKSRLVAELMARLAAEGCRAIETRCLQEWENASLRPLHVLVADLLGVGGQSEPRSSERLEHALSELGIERAIAVPLLSVWLGVPMPANYSPLAYSPQKQRQLLYSTIADVLVATMGRGAALVIEDLHWADPSTLECLNILLTKARSRPALVILTSRPDKTFTWAEPPQALALGGLSSAAAAELAAALAPQGASSAAVSQMAERSDGIPLYLEELALALASRNAGGEARQAGLDSVPDSLKGLLTSRLEQVGRGIETAQFAAAVGREFALGRLATLLAKDEISLLGDLEELVTAQVLVKRLQLGSTVFAFRHALIRDAALNTMKADSKRRCHELIAEGYVQHFEQISKDQPDLLAHHYDEAGLAAKAMEYWERAAQKSNEGSAHSEAISQIKRAIDLLPMVPASDERAGLDARLHMTQGAILVSKLGYTAPGARESFERVVELMPTQGPALQLSFGARWCLWYFHNTTASLAQSCALADELRELATQTGDPGMSLCAWTALCESRFCVGKLEEAVQASRSCAAEYDFERDRFSALKLGDDPHLASNAFECLAQMILGNHELARQRVEEGIAFAKRLGLPFLLAGMHGQAAWVYLNWGGTGALEPELERARFHAGEAIRLSQEHGFPFWEIYGLLNDSAARIAQGDHAALPLLQQGADFWSFAGAKLGRCWHLTFLARGHRDAGDFETSAKLLDEALAFCETHGSRYFEPEVRRQRAELLADAKNPRRDPGMAVDDCRLAVSQARALGAKWWELASLMTMFRVDPQSEQTRQQLASLLGSFNVMESEPPLLREARRALS